MTVVRPLAARLASWSLFGGIYLLLFRGAVDEFRPRTETSPLIEEARRSAAYVLDRQRWIVFPLTPGRDVVKLVTNAEVSGMDEEPGEELGSYVLEYELLGSNGQPLRLRTYALRAERSRYLDPAAGVLVPRHFYLGAVRWPLASRTVRIRRHGGSSVATQIRVRLRELPAPLEDVVLRVYEPEQPPEFKERYLWQRLSVAKRRNLARASVLGAERLSDEERRNLLRNRWVAVAPVGVKGKDFVTRALYTISAPPVDRLVGKEGERPDSLEVVPGMVAFVPFPSGASFVRLEIDSLPGTPVPGPDFAATAVVLRRGAAAETQTLRSAAGRIVELFAGSIEAVEVSSSRHTVLRALQISGDAEIDITPRPLRVEVYAGRPGTVLELAVPGHGVEPTLWRFDIRRALGLLPGGATEPLPPEPQARYEIFDSAGTTLAGGALAGEGAVSPYDVFPVAGSVRALTTPVRHYLVLPSRAARFELRVDSREGLVSVLTRPFDLVPCVRIETGHDSTGQAERAQRTWFTVHPLNAMELTRNGQAATVRVQGRGSAMAEASAAAARQSTLLPDGPAPSYSLLSPLRVAPADHDAYKPFRFVRLPNGRAAEAVVAAPAGRSHVVCSAIVLKRPSPPVTWRFDVDGRTQLEARLLATTSALDLPPVMAGARRVAASVDGDAAVFVSGISAPGLEHYVKRTAVAIDGDGLVFTVSKPDAAPLTLAGRVYVPAGSIERTVVRARLDVPDRLQGAILPGWTPSEIRYDIGPPLANSATAFVLGSEEADHAEAVFFFTLGADLSPGSYRMRFSLELGHGPRYLNLSRLDEGPEEVWRMELEDAPAADGEE